MKGLSLLGLSPLFINALSKNLFASSIPDLVVCEGDDPALSVRKAIEALGGISKFVIKGDNVVIKPNMAFANPFKWGNVTEPKVVAEVAKMCAEAGAKKVTVFDFPQGDAKRCLETNGIAHECNKVPGITIKMLKDKNEFKRIKINKGKEIKEVELSKEVLKADVFINIPVAKAHSYTKVSLGMKNLMGVIWDRIYFHKMVEINQAIADLATVAKPHLTILDATRAMITNGPTGPGKILELKKIIVSKDPVAVDALGVTLSQWDNQTLKPNDVGYIKFAKDMKLGEIDISKLNVKNIRV